MADSPVIVVVGSLHYDIMVEAPDRPRKGETVTGTAWRPKFGGKGGNQAMAAARLGAEVRLVGAVGDDAFAAFLLAHLQAGGVDGSRVVRLAGAGTGISVAISDSGGDYGAVIVSGANGRVHTDAVNDPSLWQGAEVLLLQNEMAEELNIAAAKAAKQHGLAVCLNAAPARELASDLQALVDVLVVNAVEAEQLCGSAVADLASAAIGAERLGRTFPTVIVTAGQSGVAGHARGTQPVTIPALPVKVASTHGAGDAFVGALALGWAKGWRLESCIRFANETAAAHVAGADAGILGGSGLKPG